LVATSANHGTGGAGKITGSLSAGGSWRRRRPSTEILRQRDVFTASLHAPETCELIVTKVNKTA
jgi:hypothetical protein